MDKERLVTGRYVVWDPPADLTGIDLEPGPPGIITGPYWQDVEVQWFLREADVVSQHVYDYHWLREVTAQQFLDACNRFHTKAQTPITQPRQPDS